MLDKKFWLAIPNVLDGVEVRVWFGPVQLFIKVCGTVLLEQKRAFPKLLPQI